MGLLAEREVLRGDRQRRFQGARWPADEQPDVGCPHLEQSRAEPVIQVTGLPWLRCPSPGPDRPRVKVSSAPSSGNTPTLIVRSRPCQEEEERAATEGGGALLIRGV